MEEQHIALPKLYGAPAYARPEPIVDLSPRPFDPDDLPIEAIQTEEERALLAELPAHAYFVGGGKGRGSHRGGRHDDGEPTLRPKLLSLKSLAGRLLGQSDN